MDNADILQIPEVQPFQFESNGNGIDNTVNLFRGDVNFYIPFVSLTGRNGLDLQVSALYKSNVNEQAITRNLTAPTSILGLGWDLPTDRIEVDTNGTATKEDNTYYFVRNSIRNRLYRNNKPWIRGKIDKTFINDLDNKNFSQALYTALLSQGLRVSADCTIDVTVSGSAWMIIDADNEFVLDLVFESTDNFITVYDGGRSYELQGYDFSRIHYYEEFERWEITYSNGITNVFGGDVITTNGIKSSKNQVIEWGVAFGNWEGPSIVTHSSSNPDLRIQEQQAKIWHFASSHTIWDDQIIFEYDQVMQNVGSSNGLPYTKASYLKKITDVFGRTVNFFYKEKEFDNSSPESPREYADPNKAVPDNNPNAFQSRYQTRYLDEIKVLNEKGDLLYDLNFRYELKRYAKATSVNDYLYGDTFKRTLVSVSKKVSTGYSFPDVEFAYYGAGDTHPGALRNMTYAEGSIVTYTYSKTELIHCSRNLKINNPLAGSTPRVWFGKDYSVVTWYNQGKLDIAIYTWIGRWQIWKPTISEISDYIDLDTLNCEIQDDFVTLYYRNANGQNYSVRTFHKNPRIIGGWIEYDKNPIVISSADCIVSSGKNYFVIADRILYSVNTYTWDALNCQWIKAPLLNYTPPPVPGSTALFMSGINNTLLFMSYDKAGAPGQKNNQLTLYYIDDLGAWHIGDTRKATEISIDQNNLDDNFHWSPLPWSITATYITNNQSGEIKYNLTIYQWGVAGADKYKFKDPVTHSLALTKSEPSGMISIPYIANCTPDGLISSGPHLMRYNGESWLTNDNLDIQQQVKDGTIFWFAVGSDYVVKSENSESRILGMVQVFDPNTQSFQWQEQAITLFDSQPTGDRLTEYFPSAAQDYLTWNTGIYKRGTSLDWVSSLKEPNYQIPQGSDTTTLINQGPNFMVYLVKSSDGKTVQGTQVLTLTNGEVSSFTEIYERFFSLVDNKGQFVAAVNGKIPGGLSSFLTYLPLDQEFENASSITLYRYLGQTLKDPIASYPASTVSLFNGYESYETHYTFDVNSAACDYQGAVAKYYRTIVAKGDSKVDGYTEYLFFNSLGDVTPNQGNLQQSTFLDGTLRLKNIYDASDHLVASSTMDYEVITEIALSPGSKADTPIFGAILQVKESISMKDGVTSSTKYTYDPASGRVSDTITQSYNGAGLSELYSKLVTYGYEKYDQLWYLNNLGPIVQSTLTVQDNNQETTVISSSVKTVKGFELPVSNSGTLIIPDIFETYSWLGGNDSAYFDFKDWSSGSGYSKNWQKMTSINVRSDHGLIIEKDSPIGKTQSTIYSKDEGVEVATISNASIGKQEVYYYGFESYEDPGVWNLDKNTPVVDTISYSGTRCLDILPGAQGAALTLLPSNQARAYLLSFWAKPDKNYNSTKAAGWKVQIKDAGKILKEINILIKASNDWQFYFESIDLSQISSNQVSIVMTPMNQGEVDVYIDNVAFTPFENPCHISVYEDLYFHVTEELGPYSETLRRFYDPLSRNIGQTDGTDGIVRLVSYFLSRQVDGSFKPDEPTALTNFQPMGDTLSDRFRNNGDYTDNWSPSNASAWTSEKGSLTHPGNSSDSIVFSRTEFERNYVAKIGVKLNGSVTAKLGILVGNDLTVQWDPATSLWQLIDHKNNQTLNSPFKSSTPGYDWTLALSEQCVFFLVDGRLAFSYVPAEMISGQFTLFTSNNVSFHNFLIGLDPQTAVKFVDGLGKTRQGQSLEKNQVTVTQTVYDDLLRPAVTTKPATLEKGSAPLLGYRSDAVTAFNWETGIMQGAIPATLKGDEGYPYSRKVFEKSPLGRTIEIGAPGKEFAITGSGNDHTVKYSYTSNSGSMFSLPDGEYFKTNRVDQNGNPQFALLSKIGMQVNNTQGDIQNTVLVAYSNEGRTKKERLPNYYNPPVNSKAEDWERISTYNTLGQLTSFEAPDSGTTSYIYNEDGLVRFSQNPEQALKGFVLYRKYDSENRIVEEGYFKYDWNQDELQLKADSDPEWPGSAESAFPQNRYYYNGDGTVLNDLGHLTKIDVMNKENPGGVDIEITHHYNDRQRLSQVSLNFVSQKVSFTTEYGYDNLGNIKSTTYPSGMKLTNLRDEVGRVISIVDENNKILHESSYNAGDQVVTEINRLLSSSPLTTDYSYNSPGWLTGINSDQLNEQITYTNDGYDGDGYYDGKSASKTIKLNVPAGSKIPSELTFKFRYDATSRAKVVACYQNDQIINEWSLGVPNPVTYDSNGNFQKVDAEQYIYDQGSDFAINTNNTTDRDFDKNKNGSTISAKPRGISNIVRDIYSDKAISINTDSNETLQFLYDDKGKRILKQLKEYNKYYCRNTTGSVLSERKITSSNTQNRDYLYSPHGLFGIKEDEKFFIVQKNHLKSPSVLLDSNGLVLSAYQYQAFGDLIDSDESNTDFLQYLFNGYELDTETGLYYAGARFYDPELKRFYSVDPKLQYASPYVFAGNNPMNMVDPTGEASWWALLIGAVVGAIVTVATGGAGAVLFGTELAASAAVGAVAGAAGSLAGDATAAGISGEKFTAGRALVDALSGFAGGLVGAGVGGAAGRGVMNAAFNAGRNTAGDIAFVTRLGTSTALIAGGVSGAVASSATTSALTGQPFFSKETALNIAIGAIAGAGGALMASGAHFGWFGAMPVEMSANDFNRIETRLDIGGNGQKLLTSVPDNQYISTKNAILENYGHEDAVFRMTPNGPENADVIALHGIGRFVFPQTTSGYSQPMSAKLFAQYINNDHPYFQAAAYRIGNVPPLKLSICFSALPGRFGSVGQTLASALGRTTYAGRGLVFPANLAQNWIPFNP